ncbi:hypothetical protein R2F25_38410 [Streptomyces sp. UP1A-1]|nr:hypothetical protein [Streptomyces sp. UP1A-1]
MTSPRAAEAEQFAQHLEATAPTEGAKAKPGNGKVPGFDFSNPDLDQVASTWRSAKGENIQGAIKRARQEFDARTAKTPASGDTAPERTVTPDALKPGDRVRVTVSGADIEWPSQYP